MLLTLHKSAWASGLEMSEHAKHTHENLQAVQQMVKLAQQYTTRVKEEKELSEDQLKTRYVGKQDPKASGRRSHWKDGTECSILAY